MFFHDFPLFCDAGGTAASAARLNLRHEAMIEPNRKVLDGARVLDLASHDGRWTFAAHKAGAAHVTGIEARRSLVKTAKTNFSEYGVPSDQYKFIRGDMFGVLGRRKFNVDVVMCLGFLYHTLRYGELFSAVMRTGAQWLLLDTKVIAHDEPMVRVNVNRTGVQSHAAKDDLSHRRKAIAGWPSVSALRLMLDVYDFDVEDEYDWSAKLSSDPDLARPAHAYATGNRVTMLCRSRHGEG